mmetsp:Transcript_32300/g.28610  ORF Transcript_32300/g.28610 Transcript_32300/m.28610 type:complete len:139 (-) Transcript_32300:91-507(-)
MLEETDGNKCKILEIDGISEDWTEEQHESVITEETDPNLNTSSSIEIKPVRESKYLENSNEGEKETKEEVKENPYKNDINNKFSRPVQAYQEDLDSDSEEENTKIAQRRKRYEQKMIETKSISESVSLSSNMALRTNL